MIKRWLHYELAEKLGDNSSGTSWQAFDQGHEEIVVLRLFRRDIRFNPAETSRLTARFARLCQENPESFAEIYFWDVHDYQQYIVREFIPGRPLELTLGSPWQFDEFLTVAKSLAKLVDLLHASNVVHGNISANNIIISDKEGKPRLSDAGIPVVSLSRDFSTQLIYRAPELIAGRTPSESADLYALGVLFYRMLTGSYPFPVSGDDDIERQILTSSPDFESPAIMRLPHEGKLLLQRLLAREPAERSQSAEQLIVTLDEIESFQQPKVTSEEPSGLSGGLSLRQYVIFSLFLLTVVVLYFIASSLYK